MERLQCSICGAYNLKKVDGGYRCLSCDVCFKDREFTDKENTLLTIASESLIRQDFDKAEEQFYEITVKCPQNHKAYWGLVCARYGIKYEEENGKRIPTCCVPTIESFSDDVNFKKALQFAPDEDAKRWYKSQAEYIDRVRKVWIEKASKEKPYDIFICYKDSDLEKGIDRTRDSYEAADLYLHLSKKYRVFYSRESLRDKIGEKYEPYIYNALQTAKVMIVYGSDADYIKSTWLKNEWQRYAKK